MNDRQTISRRGLLVGTAIGLTSGLFLDYLVLVGLWFAHLPSPISLHQHVAAPLFLLVALAGAALGAYYYSTDY